MVLRYLFISLLFVRLGLPALGYAQAPAETPTETPTEMTQNLITSIQACKDETACDAEEIESHLAIAQLARWLMGPHWKDLGEEKQQDFTSLLSRLLREAAYPRAAEFLSSTQITYGKNHVEGKEALVETLVADPGEGQVGINYRLHNIDGEWKVWDVQLDGVSMAGNLRKQVQSVMARKSYEELVGRMQKKLKWEGPQ